MAQYRALYDYLPADDASSYMTLRIYDWIDKVKDVGNGWFMGFNSNTGDFGIFPASYVEKVEKLSVKSDIAGRLLLLPDNPTAPPSQKVREEIRRMKEAVSNDHMVNVETRSTIKIEPSPASEADEGTIEKIDMTALKAEINRQLMIKRMTEEEPIIDQEPDVTDTPPEPFISSPKLIDLPLKPVISSPKPLISSPKPIISAPKPLISSPKPLISSPKPLISSPQPLISSPKPIISAPKPLISSPKPIISAPKPLISSPKPLISSPKPLISSPMPIVSSPKPEETLPMILPPKHLISPPKPLISSPMPIVSSSKPEETLPIISPPKPMISSPKLKHQKPPGLSLPPKPEMVDQPDNLPSPKLPSPPPHHKLVIGNPVLLEPIADNYPVPLQPVGNQDNHWPQPPMPSVPIPTSPLPVPTSPVHITPTPITHGSHPTISAPILQEPIGDSYPVPLRDIVKGEPLPQPTPSKPKIHAPIPIIPVTIIEQPTPIQDPNRPIISTPIPIQDPYRPIISAPTPIQDPNRPIISTPIPIQDPYRPIISTPIPIQDPNRPIISAPIPIQDPNRPIISAPIPIQDPNRPIISAPIPIEDPNRPIISAPIPIEDLSKPVISVPIPIPLTGHQLPDLPDTYPEPIYPPPIEQETYHSDTPVVISVSDIPLETDKDTKALVTDQPADTKQNKTKAKKVKPVKEKKVKEKKPKKMKEKKPPFDFKGRLYGCIANCSAKTPIKTVLLGILGGLISGGIVFVLLAFSFNYDLDIAAWITLGVTLVFAVFLALSATFRCLVLLMLPTLVTGRGRTAILAFIFAILLTGPVLNISSNAEEVSGSMACTTELIYNQTKALKHQLVEPLLKIAQKINDSFTEVKDLANALLTLIDPVINTIEQFQAAAQQAFDKLKEISLDCKSTINGAHSSCVSGINSAKTACEDYFNSIDPTDKVVDGIKDLGKALGFGKRRKRAANDKPSNQQKMSSETEKLFMAQKGKRLMAQKEKLLMAQKGKLMQVLQPQVEQPCQIENIEKVALQCSEGQYNRSRRGLLENVCVVLDISGLCGALDIAGPVCGILDTFANLANDSVQEVKDLLDKITNFFVFGLNTTFDISGSINSSQTSEQIIDNVKADILSKTTVVLYYAKIIGQVLACSLIFLLLRSFLYLSKWRAKEAYDNIYITKEFVQYDYKRKQKGKEHILPLKHREKKKYIMTRSILMAPMELKTCQKGAVMIGRSLLISTMIIAIDYALYYLLVLIETYGNININVSGTSTITLNVEGNSIIAVVLRQLASAVAINYDYNIDFNMTICLPNPHAPDTRTISLVVFLYIMAFVFMFMQAYGLRLRRKVAAHFYPEVEFDRIQYLHSKIRIKRRTIIGWIAHLITSRKKEKDVSERMTLGSWFYYSCPFMASLCGCKPAKTICLNCDRESDGLLKFHICQTKGCDAVYCTNCFKELNETCQLCKK